MAGTRYKGVEAQIEAGVSRETGLGALSSSRRRPWIRWAVHWSRCSRRRQSRRRRHRGRRGRRRHRASGSLQAKASSGVQAATAASNAGRASDGTGCTSSRRRAYTGLGSSPASRLTGGAATGHGKLAQLGGHRLRCLLQDLHQLARHAAVGGGEEAVRGACGTEEGSTGAPPQGGPKGQQPAEPRQAGMNTTARRQAGVGSIQVRQGEAAGRPSCAPTTRPSTTRALAPAAALTRGSGAPRAPDAVHVVLCCEWEGVVEYCLWVGHAGQERQAAG